MEELKRRIKKSGIERKKLAELIDVTYGTLNLYLNEFSNMPDHVREKIEKVLKDNE
jgi:transcriptional regulator with XRE-family HTH domain